jgi:hypothetical protein
MLDKTSRRRSRFNLAEKCAGGLEPEGEFADWIDHNRPSGNVGAIDAEPVRNIRLALVISGTRLTGRVGTTALRWRPKWVPRKVRKHLSSDEQDLFNHSRQPLS